MINIVAKRYYIEYGQEIKENMLRRVIQDSFPPFVLTSIAEDELVKNVKASFNAVSFVLVFFSLEDIKKKGSIRRHDYSGNFMTTTKTAVVVYHAELP